MFFLKGLQFTLREQIMLPWHILNKYEVHCNDKSRDVNSLLPTSIPLPYDIETWFKNILKNLESSMFLDYVSSHVGLELGGRIAIQLISGFSTEKPSIWLQFLANANVCFLVVIDPIAKEEIWEGRIGRTAILVLKVDPLLFISQIYPGPSILFHPFYEADNFANELMEREYYKTLAAEMVRVISNSTNIVRGNGFYGRGRPIVARFNVKLLEQLVPMEVSPEIWPVKIGQLVTEGEDDECILTALAAHAK